RSKWRRDATSRHRRVATGQRKADLVERCEANVPGVATPYSSSSLGGPMQLATRDETLAALRPYRGLEERIFAPTSSYGIQLADNTASYQFGKRGDVLPMTDGAWDYIYKIGGLKGAGLDKYPKDLVAPLLDEALRRHEAELKAVVREGEIIAFTG